MARKLENRASFSGRNSPARMHALLGVLMECGTLCLKGGGVIVESVLVIYPFAF